ncbi:TlpA disulfide reductase family protein [Fulvivirgaceae bacterium BMA10]|uniref:TlpA disulfide reductase family protein n=1 Tax=Splendidivirga corallicola TaxID=3051826 RepID=A0ABT8KVT9_9BACT|nr:TlpA disulfide reductase family protein [Fulvivirgaceae bacterium BMA10]
MKRILYLLLLSMVFNSVSNAQEKFELNGYVKGYEGKFQLILNFIKPNHDADIENEQVLEMVDGRFKLEGQLEEPLLLSIRIKPKIIKDHDKFEIAFIWIDNKKMTLIGERGNFEYCDVTGYQRQDENEKSRIYVRDMLNSYNARIDSLSEIQSIEALNEAKQLKSVSKFYLKNKYLLDFSYKNPDSFISVYHYSWFVKWLPEMVPKSQAIAFYQSLKEDLKGNIHGMQIKHYIDNVAVNRKLKVGDRPYDFSLKNSMGNTIALNDFKGNVVLLDFWASGCGPCRKEHKNYEQLYSEFHKKGFEIFSVSQDRNKERWQKAMIKDNMTWHSVWDEKKDISTYTYLVSAIPQNYLIDRNGIIIGENLKGVDLRNALMKIFNNN